MTGKGFPCLRPRDVWSWFAQDRGGWRDVLRVVQRILSIVYKEFRRDAVTLRAGALTYMVALSIVPVLALSTAVLKGLGAGDQMRQAAYRMIQQLERIDEEGAVPSGETVVHHLRRAVDEIFGYIDRTNFAALGAFGILGLLLSVVSVLAQVEQAMNAIWGVHRGRPWGRKFMDYVAFVILFPMAVNVGLATVTALENPELLAKLQRFLPLPWLWDVGLSLLPFLATVGIFTLSYRYLPNARVSFRAALFGGVTGGTAWVFLQILYVKLQIGITRYNAIYGSFATVPLLLLWIYMGWVAFLGGAEMAFVLQFWRTYRPREGEGEPALFSLALAFEVMYFLYRSFQRREAVSGGELAYKTGQPEGVVISLLERLKKAGLVSKTEDEKWSPSAPAEEVSALEVIEAFLGKEVPSTSGAIWAGEALEAIRERFSSKRLSDLFREGAAFLGKGGKML